MYSTDSAIHLSERLDSLEGLYQQINQQVLHREVIFWTVFFGVIAVIGAALFFIAKNMIERGIERGIKEKLIKNPELIGNIFLNAKDNDSQTIRLVKHEGKPVLNVESDNNDSVLMVNHKEVFCKNIIEYNSSKWHGYDGNIQVVSNGTGVVSIVIKELVGGVIYRGMWTICGDIPKELIPKQELIYNQFISKDYIIQICIGNNDDINKDKILIRIMSKDVSTEMEILRIPISTTLIYMN